jgi:hypothetical protein
MSLGLERLIVTMLYGSAVAFVVLAAMASRREVLQKLALVLLTAWALTNVAFAAIGPSAFPLAYPTIEAVMAYVVAMLGVARKSHIALGVFILYGLMIVTHLVAIVGGFTDLYAYKAAINASFIGQLLVVGVPSAWVALGRGLHSLRQRPRAVHVRR